jgi:hypothetical protein
MPMPTSPFADWPETDACRETGSTHGAGRPDSFPGLGSGRGQRLFVTDQVIAQTPRDARRRSNRSQIAGSSFVPAITFLDLSASNLFVGCLCCLPARSPVLPHTLTHGLALRSGHLPSIPRNGLGLAHALADPIFACDSSERGNRVPDLAELRPEQALFLLKGRHDLSNSVRFGHSPRDS